MFWTSTLYLMTAGVTMALGLRYGGPYKGPPVVPVVLEGGYLADTREVAAARDYHLQVLAKHAQGVKGGQGTSPYHYQQRSSYQPLFTPQPVYTQAQPYTSSLYYNTGSVSGRSRITPVSEDSSSQLDDLDYDYPFTTRRPDPMVTPRILDNGYIADTPEVDAAKGEHFAAVARAKEMVSRAQQRAAQEKTLGGYQGADHTGYQDEYPSHSSGDYTGFPEYRSDPGYSIRDRTSAGYAEDYPGYSARDRDAVDNSNYLARDRVAMDYPARDRVAVDYPARDRLTADYHARDRVAADFHARDRVATDYQETREPANYPIRDKVLAEARNSKERPLVKIPVKKALVVKKHVKANVRSTVAPAKKPSEPSEY